MAKKAINTSSGKWGQIISSLSLLISFFLPWVNWSGSLVSGYSMPLGDFFNISQKVGGPTNPFPQFSFSFYVFWLIPVLAIIITALSFLNKKVAVLSFIAGALSLASLTVYFLFSKTLLDFGVGTKVSLMIQAGFYVQAIAAFFLIVTVFPVKTVAAKTIWLLIGPLFAFGAYTVGEKYIMAETHKDTVDVKADYTVSANELIKEFISNDTATNKKYLEKVLIINGNASVVDIRADSTSNVNFADSTGSYITFSLEKDQFDNVKKIKAGDAVSLKGVCSGSIFSDILGTTSISFKRAILNLK